MFCRFFGRMANRVPDSSIVMELIKDQKKAYSLDAFKAIREFKRSIRHLPEEEKNVTVANFMYKSAGEVVLKYYEVREEMTPGENAIFEGLLNNPIFPIFTRVCQEKEDEWIKNQSEGKKQALKPVEGHPVAPDSTDEPIIDNPSEEELNSNSPLVLPSDFFSNDSYIDASILTIGNLPDWVKNAPASQFAQMINYLAGEDHGYIDPSLGNRRLLASIFSGRRLKTNRSQVKWVEKKDRRVSKTEKVMLWLCQFLYGGGFANAYVIFGTPRTIDPGDETSYANNADKKLQDRIKALYPERTPHRYKNPKEPKKD